MNCLESVFCHESDCRRYPPDFNRGFPKVNGYVWCGEFKAKEVVVCPVEEKAREEKARVEEKVAVSEPAKTFGEEGGYLSQEIAGLLEAIVEETLGRAPACDWDWLRAVLRVVADARKACGELDIAGAARKRAAELHVQQGETLEATGASSMLVAD